MIAAYFTLLAFGAAMKRTVLKKCVDLREKSAEEKKKALKDSGFPKHFFEDSIYYENVTSFVDFSMGGRTLAVSARRYDITDPSGLAEFDFHRQLLQILSPSLFWSASFCCFITEKWKYFIHPTNAEISLLLLPTLKLNFEEMRMSSLVLLEIFRSFENAQAFLRHFSFLKVLFPYKELKLSPFKLNIFCKRGNINCVEELGSSTGTLLESPINPLITLKKNRLNILKALKERVILTKRRFPLVEEMNFKALTDKLENYHTFVSHPDIPIFAFGELVDLIRNDESNSNLLV